MLSDELFNDVLLQPVRNGGNNLFIVSGYATAAMTFHHLDTVRQMNGTISIHLIVGMTAQDGLSLSNHRAFQKLAEDDFPDNFECSYIIKSPPVHSKVYAWFRDNKPLAGFIGSANYTQRAFGRYQRETMSGMDAEQGFQYFNSLAADTIYCNHPEAENFVNVYDYRYQARRRREREHIGEEQKVLTPEIQGLEFVRVSLLDRAGNLPQRSGLNWGQRPEEHREPNQAYIRLPAAVNKTDFFPERSQHFTVFTDDGKVLICTRAQDQGKAIHTPHNNSLIGEYFRHRLEVPFGRPVRTDDLLVFGRTDIVFYKLDEETYYMDFSPNENG